MYIDEQVQGRIIFTDGTEYPFTSEDIIDDDISILQQATADNSFSIGGVYSSTLNMTIRIIDKDTNSFNIIGSKIILYSKYGSEQDFVLRGVFWVTSADKYKDIYTLSGSDALIWFDNAIYDDSSKDSMAKILYEQFVKQRYSLKDCLEVICNIVNNNLVDRNVGSIVANTSIFVWNNDSPYYSGYDCGYYCVTPECASALETSSARDYLSYIAQLGAGFIECQYDGETPLITIKSFEDNFFSPKALSIKKCEDNSVELANFNIKCLRGYVEVYSGATGSWKTKSTINYQSNCYYTLDLTGNPFVDGNWAYTRRASDGDHNCMALLESLCHILGDSYKFDKGDGRGEKDYRIEVRPFKLIYHGEDRFHLGQSIMAPNPNVEGNTVKSIITKIQWNFRGGQSLECSGADNRILFDSARRTPSTRAKEQAIAKANYLANELGAKLQDQQSQLNAQWETFSTDISNLMNSISSVSGSTDSLGDAINSLWNSMYAENDTVDSLRKRIEALEGKINTTS
ncbi:MAG: hypothetical protein ACI4WH_07790 [Oscillospiraceae bacterium]